MIGGAGIGGRGISSQGAGISGPGISALIPSFELLFGDMGGGQVDILPVGNGPAGTFTRATTATTVDKNGLIVSVGSGVPRSYYDPATLAYLGYLAEGTRTNLLRWSEEFDNASWTKIRSTVSADAVVSPDGTQNADKLVEDATAANTHLALKAVTATADANYAISVFAKAAERFHLQIGAVNGANYAFGQFNLSTGVVTAKSVGGTGAVVSATIKEYPNGWYRLTVVGSLGSGATVISSSIYLGDASGNFVYNGDGVSGAYIWGAQFENNVSFASSYIPTAGVIVTRNADSLAYTRAFGSSGTLFANGRPLSPVDNAANQYLVVATDGTANEVVGIFRAPTTGNVRGLVIDGGVTQAAPAGAQIAENVSTKVAFAATTDDFAQSTDGAAVQTDTSGTMPTTTTLWVGLLNNTNQLYGTISRCAYYPVRLPNDQLQYLTK